MVKIKHSRSENEITSEEINTLSNLIQELEKNNIKIEIEEIIISSNYEEDFNELKMNNDQLKSKRGKKSALKIFHSRVDKIKTLLIDKNFFDIRDINSIKSILYIIALDSLVIELPETLENVTNEITGDIDDSIKILLKNIFKEFYIYNYFRHISINIDGKTHNCIINKNLTFKTIDEEFERSIKLAHTNYQDSKEVIYLWRDILESISSFFSDIYYIESTIENKKRPLNHFIIESEESLQYIYSDINRSIGIITKALKELLVFYNIELLNRSDKLVELKIINDPRSFYRRKNVIDTERRLVCFADILGFKEDIILDYEQNLSSTKLQDLKFALDNAFKESIQNIKSHQPQLDYRVFSDCLCLSIPFYEDKDFFYQLWVVIQAIQIFQLRLMSYGFFIRGGLSIGSYYADENMIFSNGLVKSYELELNAKHPRIVFSDDIKSRLIELDRNSIETYSWSKTFILDEDDNFVTINPFDLLHSGKFKYDKKLFIDLFGDSQNIYNFETRIEIFSKLIANKVTQYLSNDKIKSKYLWLKEFIEWLQEENNSKFKYLLK